MASPQIKNGYTPIANELLQAIYGARFNATQLKIVLLVARYTYGFSRKNHILSLSFIAEGINVHRKQVGPEISRLIDRNILIEFKPPTFSSPRVIGLNKDYDTWQVAKSGTGSKNTTRTGSKNTTRTGSKNTTQDKQNIKQKIKQGDSAAKREKGKNQEAAELFEHLWRLYPRKRGKGSVSDSRKGELLKIGRAEMERCIERFKADMEQEGRPADLYPYGGTFFNGGFADYMDENYQPPADQGERGPMHR